MQGETNTVRLGKIILKLLNLHLKTPKKRWVLPEALLEVEASFSSNSCF